MFPALEKLVADIRVLCSRNEFGQARTLIQQSDGERLLEQACRDSRIAAYESNYFRKKVLNPQHGGYIPTLLELLAIYVTEAEDYASHGEVILQVEALRSEIETFEAKDSPHLAFWKSVSDLLRPMDGQEHEGVQTTTILLEYLANQRWKNIQRDQLNELSAEVFEHSLENGYCTFLECQLAQVESRIRDRVSQAFLNPRRSRT